MAEVPAPETAPEVPPEAAAAVEKEAPKTPTRVQPPREVKTKEYRDAHRVSWSYHPRHLPKDTNQYHRIVQSAAIKLYNDGINVTVPRLTEAVKARATAGARNIRFVLLAHELFDLAQRKKKFQLNPCFCFVWGADNNNRAHVLANVKKLIESGHWRMDSKHHLVRVGAAAKRKRVSKAKARTKAKTGRSAAKKGTRVATKKSRKQTPKEGAAEESDSGEDHYVCVHEEHNGKERNEATMTFGIDRFGSTRSTTRGTRTQRKRRTWWSRRTKSTRATPRRWTCARFRAACGSTRSTSQT